VVEFFYELSSRIAAAVHFFLLLLKTKPKATMAASDQIRQMVNFILQEAHEKANEIRVKVGSDRSND